MGKEVWNNVEEFDGIYQVSNLGRIKSLPRKCGFINRGEVILKPYSNKLRWGYMYISMQCNGKRKNLLLHRVVANAFIPNPENKPQINHKDGDKSNNSVENLEWCTDKENKAHGIKMGLLPQSIKKR